MNLAAVTPLNAGGISAKYLESKHSALALGVEALDRVLPDTGLPRGQITEIAVGAGMGLATSVGLWACRAAQHHAQLEGAQAWCAFVDPSRTLFAPGVEATGVELSRLLVVHPPLDALERIAIKLAEAQVFSTLVVDCVGGNWSNPQGLATPPQPTALTRWDRVVRRLALAISNTATQVLLLTDLAARRTAPLPVALRLELQRPKTNQLWVHVAKEKRGRTQRPQLVQLQQPELPAVAAISAAPLAALSAQLPSLGRVA